MITSEIFTIHNYQIPFRHFEEPIYLNPFGDIHRSSPLCHEEKWKEYLDWARGKQRSYFVGMGDYDDLLSASERRILENSDLHESTQETLENFYRSKTELLAKELGFMRGRLIGMLEGNHFVRFEDGTTSTQYLCQLLRCKYLGVSAFVRLEFRQKTKHALRLSLDLWLHHGMGAARLIGGSLNRVEQMAEQAEADIYLMGHDHKKSVGTLNRLVLNGGNGSLRLTHRKCIIGRTGSFLRGYVPGTRSYVATRNLRPTDLGVIKIEATPRRSTVGKKDNGAREDKVWIDLHASI